MGQHDVVAIGGSSGAIEALKMLLANLPADLPAAVLVVIHVGSEGLNLLANILADQATIPISTAVDGETLKNGHAYVAPADHNLLTRDGKVKLSSGPRENMTRPAIDPLFRSVARNYGPRAIAVILSGNLNDGAAGLAEVKRCGGLTIVQDPYNSIASDMPLAALRATDVDYITPAVELGKLLGRIIGTGRDKTR